MTTGPPERWRYQVDEHRKRKHHWEEDYPGFIRVGGEIVGKCPKTLTTTIAEDLLNRQSVPYHNPRAPGPNPDRLYVVHEGMVYRAVPTVAGQSFHGFPELPQKLRELPKAVRNKILSLAEELGCKESVEEWLSKSTEECISS